MCISFNITTDDFFILTDIANASIWTCTVDTFEFTKIPLQNIGEPAAIGYDYVEERVYWTDISKGSIYRAFLNGTREEAIISSVSGEPLL